MLRPTARLPLPLISSFVCKDANKVGCLKQNDTYICVNQCQAVAHKHQITFYSPPLCLTRKREEGERCVWKGAGCACLAKQCHLAVMEMMVGRGGAGVGNTQCQFS